MFPLSYVELWSRVFALTLAVETLVAFPLLRTLAGPARRFGAVCAGQLLTHPIVWFVLPPLLTSRLAYLTVAEAWAILGEMALYRLIFAELPWSRALGISALANGASLAVGIWAH
jgi:hypothetical protein